MRQPANTDEHWPKPLARQEAAERITALVPASIVDAVWDELIAPLYDARSFTADWPQGRCRRCKAVHPKHPAAVRPRATEHAMYCPKYVGPVTHGVASIAPGFAGWRVACTCGNGYPQYDADGNKTVCPDATVDWRGPRPEPSTS